MLVCSIRIKIVGGKRKLKTHVPGNHEKDVHREEDPKPLSFHVASRAQCILGNWQANRIEVAHSLYGLELVMS
jgi:hypothetical protein